ncbi:MAG: trigger factor [Planctomycetes bacterium]|nr:trigger factor [Planctomycetota bacterium]
MSSTDTDPEDPQAPADGEEKPKQKLSLEVKIDEPGACQRHVTVTVARADVERYMEEAFDELRPKAEVPGFRPGRAPRKLVESRFKEQISNQVKGSLLSDTLAQISEEQELTAISEPSFDFDAIEIPDDGPFTFEFDVEVRPKFAAPNWKGLELERAVHEYSEEEIDRRTAKLLQSHGQLVERAGGAEPDDLLDASVRVTHEGQLLAEHEHLELRVAPDVSFRDATVTGFQQCMAGVLKGESRHTKVTISEGAENVALRGKEVDVDFHVHGVKQLEPPKLTPAFLDELGGFEDEDDLREAVREELNRQVLYYQQQRLRQQITAALTRDANWELPPDLLRRQAKRELERTVLELQSSGFSDEMIRKQANKIHQNSLAVTARSIKEHFIFERIAEDAKIEAEADDYEDEIRLIADQSGDSARRVRARLEKRGQMDVLRNQIVERKVVALICGHAYIRDVPLDEKSDDVFAVNLALAGVHGTSEIPEAKHGGEAEEMRGRADRYS